jgi:DNA-directed RNA polymerase specialized sigma24 family protein
VKAAATAASPCSVPTQSAWTAVRPPRRSPRTQTTQSAATDEEPTCGGEVYCALLCNSGPDGLVGAVGDERDDFEYWYRREHPRLVTLLAASTGDTALATEATDEAFARAFERWPRVSKMDSPAGWTYRVALNVVRRRARRRARELRTMGAVRAVDVPGPTGELWILVADLPPRQRTAVLLRHVGHLTEQEVADVMGVARGTVSSTLRSAYQRLRIEIELEEPTVTEVER